MPIGPGHVCATRRALCASVVSLHLQLHASSVTRSHDYRSPCFQQRRPFPSASGRAIMRPHEQQAHAARPDSGNPPRPIPLPDLSLAQRLGFGSKRRRNGAAGRRRALVVDPNKRKRAGGLAPKRSTGCTCTACILPVHGGCCTDAAVGHQAFLSCIFRAPRAASNLHVVGLRLPPIDHPQDLIALKAAAQESRVQPSVDSPRRM